MCVCVYAHARVVSLRVEQDLIQINISPLTKYQLVYIKHRKMRFYSSLHQLLDVGMGVCGWKTLLTPLADTMLPGQDLNVLKGV